MIELNISHKTLTRGNDTNLTCGSDTNLTRDSVSNTWTTFLKLKKFKN